VGIGRRAGGGSARLLSSPRLSRVQAREPVRGRRIDEGASPQDVSLSFSSSMARARSQDGSVLERPGGRHGSSFPLSLGGRSIFWRVDDALRDGVVYLSAEPRIKKKQKKKALCARGWPRRRGQLCVVSFLETAWGAEKKKKKCFSVDGV